MIMNDELEGCRSSVCGLL